VTPNQYQELAERTSATATNEGQNAVNRSIERLHIRLLHAGMGMCTEAGEFQDELKCCIFYGRSLDESNLAEECGDLLWYIAEALNALGVTMETVMHQNIAKLKVRYPEKFSSDDALNRDLEQERKALEG